VILLGLTATASSNLLEVLMSTKLSASDRAWKASELRRLPAAERDDILAKAAALAESDYRSKPQLTDFEAFGEDDLHGDSTAAPAGVRFGRCASILLSVQKFASCGRPSS
jgi:hypothetical protein